MRAGRDAVDRETSLLVHARGRLRPEVRLIGRWGGDAELRDVGRGRRTRQERHVPLIVAPDESTTVTPERSSPLTLMGCAANCGVSESSPRARRM
jgi:hypothetical protein